LQSRLWIALLLALMFTACSKHQPPVQMMAEARAAIQAAHNLIPQADNSPADPTVTDRMAEADDALQQAAHALSKQRFGKARITAQRARDLARQIIQQLHRQNNSVQ